MSFGNDFRFLYSVVSTCQRTRKPNAKRKLAFGFAEVQPFFETQSQTALSTPFPFVDSAKLERTKKARFKLLCIVNYKVNNAISIVNYTIPRAFKSLTAIIF